MKRSDVPARGKPVVAERNAAAAIKNLEVKLELIVEVLKQASRGSAVRSVNMPDLRSLAESRVIPVTLRQFHLWSFDKIPDNLKSLVPHFGRNASTTLRRSPLLQASVTDALEQVRNLYFAPTAQARKETTVATLRSRVRLSNTLRQIAERELVASRREIMELERIISDERARRESIEREAAESIRKLERKVRELSARLV